MRAAAVALLVVIAAALGFGGGWLAFHEDDPCDGMRGAERIVCTHDTPDDNPF